MRASGESSGRENAENFALPANSLELAPDPLAQPRERLSVSIAMKKNDLEHPAAATNSSHHGTAAKPNPIAGLRGRLFDVLRIHLGKVD